MHTYLPNGHIGAFTKVALKGSENRSKRYESWHVSLKLVRSETLSCIFARVGIEGVQIAQTIAKVGVNVFISNGHPNL